MIYYSIKYIGTKGILECHGPIVESDEKSMIPIKVQGSRWSVYHYLDKDVFCRREDAISAGVTRLRKLAESSDKRAQRLRARADEMEASL